jgi:3',5'-cyclic AMP phosphodiesterase CpdA
MSVSRREFLCLAGAMGLGWSAWGSSPKSASGGFSIATMNDLHILEKADTEYLKAAVAQINAVPEVRAVVVLGDITYNASRERFEWAKEALDGLKMPYRAVPGNHDVQGKGLAYADYSRYFGARSWVWPFEGWHFIGLDSCVGSAGEVSIPMPRMAWLKEQLQSIPAGRPIALFTHHLFNPHSLRPRVRNADQVVALFAKHRLRLIAAGHWHGNQVETQDGILYTTTACCSSARDNHDYTPFKGFRLFHFQADQVETEFVPVAQSEGKVEDLIKQMVSPS